MHQAPRTAPIKPSTPPTVDHLAATASLPEPASADERTLDQRASPLERAFQYMAGAGLQPGRTDILLHTPVSDVHAQSTHQLARQPATALGTQTRSSACNATTPRDYGHEACLPWCINDLNSNCPRCKCRACSYCSNLRRLVWPLPTSSPQPLLSPPLVLPPPPPPTPAVQAAAVAPAHRLRTDFGLCSTLAPASLFVGDSVSGQFFRTISELLGGQRQKGANRRGPTPDCHPYHSAGCVAMRTLPPNSQTALVCNRSVWIAYIRNDWLDVAPSYPVPDGPHGPATQIWHCARDVDEMSPDSRKALRKATHLCGPPSPNAITCNGRACIEPGTTPTPACMSTCELATKSSCGSSTSPCAGCSAAWAIPALCDTVKDREGFCSSTEENEVEPPEGTLYHTAHCIPWSAVTMLKQFRVLVLNAGAHRMPPEAYRGKMDQVASVIRSYLAHNREGSAIFRATVPGFSGCNETREARPHASIEAAEAYLRAHPFYEQHEFVPIANQIAAEAIVRGGGRVLDVYPSSILRLDDRAGTQTYHGLMDCLHYRSPLLLTSLATWARMLGELLANKQH